jgi:hypothetical protein
MNIHSSYMYMYTPFSALTIYHLSRHIFTYMQIIIYIYMYTNIYTPFPAISSLSFSCLSTQKGRSISWAVDFDANLFNLYTYSYSYTLKFVQKIYIEINCMYRISWVNSKLIIALLSS